MQAWAPGSVTALFAPPDAPGGGVSFATEDGVTATVEPATESRVLLDGEPTDFEPVELAVERLGIDASVELDAEVPLGCGFGSSGAATLATVLAAGAEWDLYLGRDRLVEVAAEAERRANTGVSDVYVQEMGGLAWDLGDARKRTDRTDEVAYATFGDIETGSVLGDESAMARVGTAAERGFAAFDPEAPLSDIFEVGWSFAEDTGLVTPRVRRAVETVREKGGAATMAMVGETVIAVGTDGTVRGDGPADPFDGATASGRTRISPEGAHLL
ncbi:MAG: GHMP kinase [Halobacteriales archaeon]